MLFFFCTIILYLSCTSATRNQCVDYDGAVVSAVSDKVMVHGEGPFWDSENNILYFVDIAQHRVYKWVENKLDYVQLDEDVSFVIPVAKKKHTFAIGLGRQLASLQWYTDNINGSIPVKVQHLTKLATVDNDKPGNRWNDAKADPKGQLWAGTMGFEDAAGNIPTGQGTLYKLNDIKSNQFPKCTQNVKPVLPRVSVSNGMAWSKDGSKMYYIDSPTKQIDLFDYDSKTDSINNRRPFYNFSTDFIPGVPDGMTIDENDNIWIANYGGAQVLHVSGVSGKLLGKLPIKAKYVSSVTFGGNNLDKLYVTTLSRGVSLEQFKEYPMSGKVLEVSGLGVKGLPNRWVQNKCFQ
ncbi:regucalcin-like [Daktulosphaira vitifoliae]|uniref:regucalcin-like n=1 Tax=Daktulosphaira vitifoliae TaxID=58002 RepID=UPI0021AA8C88|nr:regucalcin-like [Daktulosphaira vitifoliae]